MLQALDTVQRTKSNGSCITYRLQNTEATFWIVPDAPPARTGFTPTAISSWSARKRRHRRYRIERTMARSAGGAVTEGRSEQHKQKRRDARVDDGRPWHCIHNQIDANSRYRIRFCCGKKRRRKKRPWVDHLNRSPRNEAWTV